MKDGIHPKYQDVVIKDISSGFQMITRSTKSVKERITVDGVEYPLITVEVSSASHPYYTGKQILVGSAGRIDRFKSRYTEVVGRGHDVWTVAYRDAEVLHWLLSQRRAP